MKNLTPREKEVLALVSNGKKAREIGELLGISTRTVDAQKSNVLRKYGAVNMQHAVRLGIEKGDVILNDKPK
jgi:DNA-binding CsgD family transcriptional regulator